MSCDESVFARFSKDPDYTKLATVYSVCEEKRRDRKTLTHKPLRRGETDERMYEIIFQRILQPGGNIDYQLPADSPVQWHAPELLGYTALHFAVDSGNESILASLLALGANPTVRNARGFTALRLAIERSRARQARCLDLLGTLVHPLACSILDAQIVAGNLANPRCNDGLSHFHIACMLNHTKAIEFFLHSGAASVDESLPLTSKFLPGYTALHLAARYCSFDAIRILMARGADGRAKEAGGAMPLHLLIDLKVHLKPYTCFKGMDTKSVLKMYDDNVRKTVSNDIENIEDAVDLLLADSENGMLHEAGLSRLHVTCTRVNVNTGVDAAVVPDSPFYPGYTPLHFAAHFNTRVFHSLLRRGATAITAKDANGVTPLEIYVSMHGADSLCYEFQSLTFLGDVHLSNGDKLLDVLSGRRSICDYLQRSVSTGENVRIPLDSPVWPGCNLLHVAVHMTQVPVDCDAISERLDYTADLYVRVKADFDKEIIGQLYGHRELGLMLTQGDANNATPLHLAFHQRKFRVVRELARIYSFDMADPADDGGLSHSHIFACLAIRANISTGRVDLQTTTSLRKPTCVPAGSTALHLAVADGRCVENVKALMAQGANASIKDEVDGMTPIHLAAFEGSYLTSLLLPHPDTLEENVTAKGGLSYFHIACHQSNLEAIRVYLKLGVDVNQPLLDDYHRYNSLYLSVEAGDTPLHMAVKGRSVDVARLLLEHGANLDARSASGLTPLHLALRESRKPSITCARLFLAWLLDRDLAYVDDAGVTLLHVACACVDEAAVKRLLQAGSNVDARIHQKSTIFPGGTPLHVLLGIESECMFKEEAEVERIALLLLRHGADLGAKDALHRSPLHNVYYSYEVPKKRATYPMNLAKIALLLKNQGTPMPNPCDGSGLSHLHLAVLATQEDEECVDVVTKYLRESADPGHATDPFYQEDGGFAALHFATAYDAANLIEALVEHGGDLRARDRSGSNALYYLIARPADKHLCRYSSDKFHAIIKLDAALANATNALGTSALQAMLNPKLISNYDWFVEAVAAGARANVYNPISGEGMLGALINFVGAHDETFVSYMIGVLEPGDIDTDTGGNYLHNVVSTKYNGDAYLIDSCRRMVDLLLQRGVQLEHRNNRGETPLHLAAKFANLPGLRALLANGADANLKDYAGHTPPFYADGRYQFDECKPAFTKHLSELQDFQLDIDESNQRLLDARKVPKPEADYTQVLSSMKCIWQRHESELSFRDFILGEEAARTYPSMALWKRLAIEEYHSYVKSFDYPYYVQELFSLQLAKARERAAMMEAAKSAIALLIAEELPDPCSEGIIRHLRNIDLRVLVSMNEQ